MFRYYAGIGSRKTPREVCEEMEEIAKELYDRGFILRSGGARGADSAFERGAGEAKAIYRPDDIIPEWCYFEVAIHVPPNRPPFNHMKTYTQNLLARNMLQVLGDSGEDPSEFVVCWTPADSKLGGTGYAIRCAIAHKIPVYNLRNESDRIALIREVFNGA